MIDHCGSGWNGRSLHSTHCLSSGLWTKPDNILSFGTSGILQIGGMAHSRPNKQLYGWKYEPIGETLRGCISHLRINDEVCRCIHIKLEKLVLTEQNLQEICLNLK